MESKFIYIGSALAVGFGTTGYHLMNKEGLNYAGMAALAVAIGGLITAIAGLVNSSLARVLPFFKIYIEDRRADLKAKDERHNLADKVNEQVILLAEAHQQINENKETIEQLEKTTKRYFQG